jgi:hypothetical protein
MHPGQGKHVRISCVANCVVATYGLLAPAGVIEKKFRATWPGTGGCDRLVP